MGTDEIVKEVESVVPELEIYITTKPVKYTIGTHYNGDTIETTANAILETTPINMNIEPQNIKQNRLIILKPPTKNSKQTKFKTIRKINHYSNTHINFQRYFHPKDLATPNTQPIEKQQPIYTQQQSNPAYSTSHVKVKGNGFECKKT